MVSTGFVLDLFSSWLSAAKRSEPNDPTAMSLSTVGVDGFPSSRMVLLKGFDERGFVFYTNLESHKGVDLVGEPRSCLLFHWKSLRRQVRVEGFSGLVGDEEADLYFASRPRGAQLGAWASLQTRELRSRGELARRVVSEWRRFRGGEVPRPPHWSGFRLAPLRIEFWSDGRFRLHDRLFFERADVSSEAWTRKRLYP